MFSPLLAIWLEGLSWKSLSEARTFSCCHFDPIRGLLFLVTKLLLSLRKEKAFQSSTESTARDTAPLYYVNWIIVEGNNDNLKAQMAQVTAVDSKNEFCNKYGLSEATMKLVQLQQAKKQQKMDRAKILDKQDLLQQLVHFLSDLMLLVRQKLRILNKTQILTTEFYGDRQIQSLKEFFVLNKTMMPATI